MKPIGSHSGFSFVRGPKPTLKPEVFFYALLDFWKIRHADTTTLSFESLLHEPHSPGRVFLLDENEIIKLLIQLEDLSNGTCRWSETAGLKQLVRTKGLCEMNRVSILEDHYKAR